MGKQRKFTSSSSTQSQDLQTRSNKEQCLYICYLSHFQVRPGETKDERKLEKQLYIYQQDFLLKNDRLNDAGFSNSQNLRCPKSYEEFAETKEN